MRDPLLLPSLAPPRENPVVQRHVSPGELGAVAAVRR